MTPPHTRGRVLVVDEDWGILDLITRQVLEPLGYSTENARDADGAIQQSLIFEPDLIIASLTLPGLSGKDLIVALHSRGVDAPVLVTAIEGMEADAIQAFRLGARDVLAKPLREAEVVAAVEHALDETRLRKERQELADQLARSNRQLEQRVRELTTLFSIGKVVTSTTSQPQLLMKLLDACVAVADADMGWILLHDDTQGALMLRAERGFPSPVAGRLNQAWDDGLGSLVMQSGEAMAMHGERLAQFELDRYARAAMVSPINVHAEPAGVIGVAREEERSFVARELSMLSAIADYASISLVNARLLQVLKARANKLEQVLDERKYGIHIQTPWLEDMSERLTAIREQLALVAQASRTLKTKAGLKAISSQLKELMKDMAGVADEQIPVSKVSAPEAPLT